MPLVANVNGTLAPGFAVEMLRVALVRARSVRLLTADGGVDSVSVGDKRVRTERDGAVRALLFAATTRTGSSRPSTC